MTPEIDDRMQAVISAYYQAVADKDDALATALAKAIDAGDVETGVRLVQESTKNRAKP
jgi:hypothetical protein